MQITADYQTLIAQLEKNDPNFVHLHLKDITLTILQLEEIASKIQSNDFIGNVSWGENLKLSDDFIQKIESKIIINNQNYKHYPSDFIHGLFSSHAYINSNAEEKVVFENSKYNQYLEDWKTFKIFNEPKIGRYYAVAYVNDKTKQLVLAYRGITFEKLDLLKTNSSLKTHFKSVLGGQIVAQQAASYQTTKEITEYAKNHGYNLSFTGYSLGAWFAELSLYFAYQDFNYSKTKAVTFDSPGSAKVMAQFKSNIYSYETDFNVRNLNITTYLSAPNFVNTSNPHIHKAYRLFPKVTSSKIVNILNKTIPIVSMLTLNRDLLDSILDVFDPETGKPVKYEKILDWPCLQYDSTGDTLGAKLLDSVPIGGVIKDLTSNLIRRGITATTLGSFLEVVDHFISGNIAIEQILEFYKHLENPEQTKIQKQFNLFYKGHYRSQEVDLSKDIADINNKGGGDWYLCQLAELNLDAREISNLVKQQLKIIKEQYKVEHKNSKAYIFTNSLNIKVDDLREQILRLVEVSNETKTVLKDRNAYYSNNIKSINSNLPTLIIHSLIHRKDVFTQIDTVLRTEQCVAISAFAGTGKTTLAMEYGRKQIKEAKKIVRFINADSAYKIAETYRQLTKELSINVEAEKEEEIIINLVCNKINNLNSNTLFIFDNVEVYEDVKPYLNGIMNIPKNKAQAIITTKNNNLNEDIENIRLEPFNKDEATKYLEKSLENILSNQDINILLKEFSDENTTLPYSISKAVAYFKNNKLLKVNDYINFIRSNKDEHPETILLLEILEKSPIAWHILQCSAYLDPDFISIDIFKELFLLDEEKLQEPIKKLESLSLMNLIYQNGQAGLQLHRLMQATTKRYAEKNKEHAIDEQKIYRKLLETLDKLFPILTDVPNKDWEISKTLYPHVIKILNDNIEIEIDKLRKVKLYQKLGYYNNYILCKFKESLKYQKEALKICQELYNGNHPNVACFLDEVGVIYINLK